MCALVAVGSITAYTGPPTSGKTFLWKESVSTLIRVFNLEACNVGFYLPAVMRGEDEIQKPFALAGLEIKPRFINQPQEIPQVGIAVAIIESAHLLGESEHASQGASPATNYLLDLKRRAVQVFVAGLLEDYLGKPYLLVQELTQAADRWQKQRANCAVCGQYTAECTQILRRHPQYPIAVPARDAPSIIPASMLRGMNLICEARCLECWKKPRRLSDDEMFSSF